MKNEYKRNGILGWLVMAGILLKISFSAMAQVPAKTAGYAQPEHFAGDTLHFPYWSAPKGWVIIDLGDSTFVQRKDTVLPLQRTLDENSRLPAYPLPVLDTNWGIGNHADTIMFALDENPDTLYIKKPFHFHFLKLGDWTYKIGPDGIEVKVDTIGIPNIGKGFRMGGDTTPLFNRKVTPGYWITMDSTDTNKLTFNVDTVSVKGLKSGLVMDTLANIATKSWVKSPKKDTIAVVMLIASDRKNGPGVPWQIFGFEVRIQDSTEVADGFYERLNHSNEYLVKPKQTDPDMQPIPYWAHKEPVWKHFSWLNAEKKPLYHFHIWQYYYPDPSAKISYWTPETVVGEVPSGVYNQTIIIP